MSRKDYVAIAKCLSLMPVSPEKSALITELCDTFKRDNPNFDRGRFIEACRYVAA